MSFSIKLLSKLLMRLVLVQTREDIVAAWENSLQLQTQLCIHWLSNLVIGFYSGTALPCIDRLIEYVSNNL